ncbi:MAG: hypothetical protein J3K34DRAFT_442095 [Monoraphidium minutum]|nr:MAG: hypothetical protein J3K34DRAFT_442095 [Monoraphidium minutum]
MRASQGRACMKRFRQEGSKRSGSRVARAASGTGRCCAAAAAAAGRRMVRGRRRNSVVGAPRARRSVAGRGEAPVHVGPKVLGLELRRAAGGAGRAARELRRAHRVHQRLRPARAVAQRHARRGRRRRVERRGRAGRGVQRRGADVDARRGGAALDRQHRARRPGLGAAALEVDAHEVCQERGAEERDLAPAQQHGPLPLQAARQARALRAGGRARERDRGGRPQRAAEQRHDGVHGRAGAEHAARAHEQRGERGARGERDAGEGVGDAARAGAAGRRAQQAGGWGRVERVLAGGGVEPRGDDPQHEGGGGHLCQNQKRADDAPGPHPRHCCGCVRRAPASAALSEEAGRRWAPGPAAVHRVAAPLPLLLGLGGG